MNNEHTDVSKKSEIWDIRKELHFLSLINSKSIEYNNHHCFLVILHVIEGNNEKRIEIFLQKQQREYL